MPQAHRPTLLVTLGLVLALSSGAPLSGQGTKIGFEEEFALATDREAVLEQLIPGTPDFYFYHCLHLQNEGRVGEVKPLLETWVERHGRTQRVMEIENRQALLRFDEDPKGSLEYLRKTLDLNYRHARRNTREAPDLPTRLDPKLLAWSTLRDRAFSMHPGTLDGFRSSALEQLTDSALDEPRLAALLSRLKRPDVAGLPALVIRDLGRRGSPGFGSHSIHAELLLEQLEECARLDPDLLGNRNFVRAWLRKLSPEGDADLETDADAREACLDRLEVFTRRLPPSWSSLKAHVLYHRLAHDRQRGVHDNQRFLDYLRLPRNSSWSNREYARQQSNKVPLVELDTSFETGFPSVGDDDELIQAYLAEFFRTENSISPYQPFMKKRWLESFFAETKILLGQGDMERWYSLLDDPARYERLKERVEIDFAPTQPRSWGMSDTVALDVDLKNVDTLLVKLFEIDAFNYYRAEDREVDMSIDLDGLVASEETTHHYDDNPLRRVRRRFEFPSIDGPGVFIVELIGNGISSRALIRKGGLQRLERVGAAGHVFTILDEAGRVLPGATAWVGNREYQADEDGEIAVPYSSEPGRKTILFRHGERAGIDQFMHRAEDYSLQAGVLVDRESLLSGEKAKIAVRPSLWMNGRAVSLALLDDPLLSLEATDHDGVVSSQVVRNLDFASGLETVHEIQVPERLATLTISLGATVRHLGRNEVMSLSSRPVRFQANGITATAHISCPLLGRSDRGYHLDVLGKNGEPKAGRVVELAFEHRHFRDPVQLRLKTDERGRIELGELVDVVRVRASGLPQGVGAWDLRSQGRSVTGSVHGVAGEDLRVPYDGSGERPSRRTLALLEVRGESYAFDRFSHLSIEGGAVVIRGLPPGDYELWLEESGTRVDVEVVEGEAREGWALGRRRMLELAEKEPMLLTSLSVGAEALEIDLRNADRDSRVHVFASRYLTPYNPLESLRIRGRDRDARSVEPLLSEYESGRVISDEYRYILERRYAKKFPGNMLERPGLLLNSWALSSTNTMIGLGGGAGGGFGGKFGRRGGGAAAGGVNSMPDHRVDPGTFPELDFLSRGNVLLFNLRPDESGRVRVPIADLGPGQLVHVLAVDAEETIYTTAVLPERPMERKDRSLILALDADRHYTEQRKIEFLEAEQTASIADLATLKSASYDSLTKVYELFVTLNGGSGLSTFSFVLGWPELEEAEKRALYSEHACHELHFFLYKKDPEFFGRVVRPHLAQKMHKTFLDHYLLEGDLSPYLDPWAFGRLNIVERVLLGRRISGEAGNVAGHVRDLNQLFPPDPNADRFRFDTLLKSRALDATADFDAMVENMSRLEAFERRKEVAAPGGPATPGPVAGGGGRDGRATRLGDSSEKKNAESDVEAGRHLQALGYLGMEEAFEEIEPEVELSTDRNRAVTGAKDFKLREEQRQLYRAPEQTREYVEHNYWQRQIQEQVASLIDVNPFWADFAGADPSRPFISGHFAEATGNVAEMMFALSVLGLPFEAKEHAPPKSDGSRGLQITAASPMFLVTKEILEASSAGETTPVLVSQNFFSLADRYAFEGNQRRDKYVTKEFVVDTVYGCQVVLTNPTSTPRRLELLLQIPRGSLPVQRGFKTDGRGIELDAWATQAFEYHFYFPESGSFSHYPVHVSRDGELLAFVAPRVCEVIDEPRELDTESWDHISQDGSVEQLYDYLDRKNLHRLDLGRIAWRMRDRAVFDGVIERLRRRKAYDGTLWSYGLFHGNIEAGREFLRHQDGFLDRCGRAIESVLVSIDPVERQHYQHVEYRPLFNPRAHRFGRQYEILNSSFAGQYRAFMDVLAYRPRLDDLDWMAATYYLLLQDRVEHALAAFGRVDPERLETRVQYDYTRAYLDFFSDQSRLAREIAEQYRDHPVDHWRVRFEEVLAHLDEAEGKGAGARDLDSVAVRQDALASGEPTLEVGIDGAEIRLRHQQLEAVELRFYEMDVEFLFSSSPFVKQGAGSFAYVRPNLRRQVELDPQAAETLVAMPEEMRSKNVLVEVRGPGVAQRQAHYANSLAVQMMENYGQLKVTHAEDGRPLSRVYVKVFGRNGADPARFYKDGYTDLRGRFDYASLSGDGEKPDRFAVLVLSEGEGAVIREVASPLK